MSETITAQEVREMSEVLASWSSFVSSGYECPAAGTAMHAAHVMLLALVEERDRLAAGLDHQIVERAALAARAEAAEAALRDAQKRLRGAGMLGSDDDPVNAALKEGGREQ